MRRHNWFTRTWFVTRLRNWWGNRCPRCLRVQHLVCGNKECACWTRIPKGKLPQRWVPKRDALTCPYCGFTAHVDYWEDRELWFCMPHPEAVYDEKSKKWRRVRALTPG